MTERTELPIASGSESLAVLAEVVAPLIAKGVIKRRRSMTELAGRTDADARAVRRLQQLRRTHGPTTVRLRVPGRALAVVLAPDHVRQLLDGTPEPFAAATVDKRSALAHFQPHGVLISDGSERADRRRVNEEVLDFDRSPHRLAGDLLARTHDEVDRLGDLALRLGTLGYDDFVASWWRLVRRVVLGDVAADDHLLTDQLARLRDDANWAWAHPRRRRLRRAFDERLESHLSAAEPGSLASLVDQVPATAVTQPQQQVPQWLFAFDAAGIALWRALALLATHPAAASDVRDEVDGRDLHDPVDLPGCRGLVLEALRLWPTTPAILRQATRDASLHGAVVPAGTELLIHAPFLHRDDERLVEAHRLAPDLWNAAGAAEDWPLVPFSAGPATCAGRDLVLLLTAAALGRFAQRLDLRLVAPTGFGPPAPLPGTLSPFRERFGVSVR